jgi:hypothetical protein
MMTASRGRGALALVVTGLLLVLALGGCTSIKYSYDMKSSFPAPKNYAWAPSETTYGKDPLLESNVQVFADQLLAQKGYARTSEKPDLMVTMSYEYDSSSYRDNYELRMLTLNVYQIKPGMPSPSDVPKTSAQKENNAELVWRGTAFGSIRTDAASADLKKAVQGILSNFPPK